MLTSVFKLIIPFQDVVISYWIILLLALLLLLLKMNFDLINTIILYYDQVALSFQSDILLQWSYI